MVNYRSNFGFFILLLNFVTNVHCKADGTSFDTRCAHSPHLCLNENMLCRFWHSMCVMSPSAGTGAVGLHVELCVPNENHRVYSVVEANHVDAAPAAPAPTLLSIKPTF
jgi:hypothetical protein